MRVDPDGKVIYEKMGKIVIVTILNVVPNGYHQMSLLPKPKNYAYNAVTSIDGAASIWQVSSYGYILMAIGDINKTYTGSIVYITKD